MPRSSRAPFPAAPRQAGPVPGGPAPDSSHENQGIVGRWKAGNERGPDAPRVGRKDRHELRASGPHDFPVRPRVRHDEHQATRATVPSLGGNPSEQRLDVVQAGFGLDRDGVPIPDENAIPRTRVAGATDRNLGTPPPAGSDPRPETRQQPEMGDVPNRGTGGIGTRAEIETDHREHGGHALDGNAGRTTPLDATD